MLQNPSAGRNPPLGAFPVKGLVKIAEIYYNLYVGYPVITRWVRGKNLENALLGAVLRMELPIGWENPRLGCFFWRVL